MEHSLRYREVIPDQTANEKWTEITLNTGGAQSTLQDIKVAERSGGYSYQYQTKYFTRNRFIYWRICQDVLELVEQSLDVNLTGNRIRYRFIDTPVLDGVTIHEAFNSVIVLVATVSSVHRLVFPHPDIIHNQEHVFPRLGVDYSAKSIFAEASVNDARNPSTFHVINNASTGSALPYTSCTGLSSNQQHLLFALAYNGGVILLVKMDSMTGIATWLELKQQFEALIMPRFLTRAFRGKSKEDESAVSMLFHEIASETYLFSLCGDGNIRLWSTQKNHCNIVTDMTLVGDQGAQHHMIRKSVSNDRNQFLIATLLCSATHSAIHLYKPTIENNSFHLRPILVSYMPKDEDVIDFAVTLNEEIWALFRSPQGEPNVACYKNGEWVPCILENPLDGSEIPLDLDVEAKQNYVDFIFHPGRFPISVINKALSVAHVVMYDLFGEVNSQSCLCTYYAKTQQYPFGYESDLRKQRFSLNICYFILIPLDIYRKSNIVTDSGVSVHVLKERVCSMIDAQISAELEERDYAEDEVVELINNCWQKFYSCCVEYYEGGTRPIGLLLLAHQVPQATLINNMNNQKKHVMFADQENDSESSESYSGSREEILNGETVTSGVVLIKKSYVSLLRPMDALETVALSSNINLDMFKTNPDLMENGLSSELLKLVKILIYLDDNLPEEIKVTFDKSLKQLKSPRQAISEIFSNDIRMGDEDTITNLDLLYNVAVNLETINNVEELMNSLLDLLDIGQPDLSEGYDKIENTKWLIHLGHLYGSQFAMSFVSNSLYQIVVVRYELCRCLLVFQQLLLTDSFQQFINTKKLIDLGESTIERTCLLIRCYNILVWMTQTPIHMPLAVNAVDNCVSILKLNESNKNLLFQSNHQQRNRNVTVLELFLQTSASTTVRLLLSKREIPQPFICLWHQSLLPYVHILAQLVWPQCNNTVFPEFLLISGQHLHVQEYSRLLSKWCHSNTYTRKFLLACAFLDSGEHHKAFDIFHKAAHGVTIGDTFIINKVVQAKEHARERLVTLYYLKVIKLFEQQNLSDLIIDLANFAIEVSSENDPELPTLFSIVFLNHLHIGQFNEAYDSLVSNPDEDRKKDCLRQLVVSLFESRSLDTLMNFPFTDMQNDLERIIEGRARSLDVLNNEYYNFLYAYHVLKGSMRKAACVMYEQAFRLAVGSIETSVKVLEKQCNFYAATLNCLSLVKKEDAWIVKPLMTPDGDGEMDDAMNSFADEGFNYKQLKYQIHVLEVKDIEKEYSLCKTRLKLMKFSPEQSCKITTTLNAHEIVGLLTNVGLYKDALFICTLFEISPEIVLSGLAVNCVRLDETQCSSAWDWLPENDVTDLGDGNAANLTWRLLQSLLTKHELSHQSILHKAVTSKLLQLGVFIPYWLLASYKLRNPAELLRLLLENGRLEECAELAIEYVEAVLGKGKERFNLETSLMPQNPPTWLPYNVFDVILLELETYGASDFEYKKLHSQLTEVLNKYLVTASQVSEDKIKMIQQSMSRL